MRLHGDDFIRARLARNTLKADTETGQVFGRRGLKSAWSELIGWADPDGYLRIGIGLDGDHRLVAVHRIILIAAYGEIPDGLQPDHINRNPADNRLENLRIVTCRENLMNRTLHDQRGSKNKSAKLTEESVIAIKKLLAAGHSHSAIARMDFGVCRGNVSQIASGRTWTHVTI